MPCRLLTSLVLLPALLLAGCDRHQGNGYEVGYSETPPEQNHRYVVGVHPLHNPVRLHELFQPLMQLLNEQVEGVEFVVEASRNYATYNEKLAEERFDFAIPNPYQTVKALRYGYHVIGKMADDDRFRGIILVRRDSGIDSVEALQDKRIAFPAPTALAATMLPQRYLQQQGLLPGAEYEPVYVGSQESSIMNVYLGNVAAAATWPPPWQALSSERPELERELKVFRVTEPLPNNSVMAHERVPAAHRYAVAQVLFSLHQRPRGKQLLERMAITGFGPADNDTYQPVRRFLTTFSREVRPLEGL
ncbi:MAG: phosphate/phosphite/phosphonate ABC transporter substrate-binding protein [Pseudomonadota bacterium]